MNFPLSPPPLSQRSSLPPSLPLPQPPLAPCQLASPLRPTDRTSAPLWEPPRNRAGHRKQRLFGFCAAARGRAESEGGLRGWVVDTAADLSRNSTGIFFPFFFFFFHHLKAVPFFLNRHESPSTKFSLLLSGTTPKRLLSDVKTKVGCKNVLDLPPWKTSFQTRRSHPARFLLFEGQHLKGFIGKKSVVLI